MPNAMNEPPFIQPAPVRKKRRWWLYALIVLGCLVVLGVGLVVAILGYINSLVTKYTDSQPKALVQVEASPGKQEELKNKWTAFQQSVTAGRSTRPFKLSADDLNVFLANIPNLRDRLRFVINGDKLQGDFTVPLDETRQAKLKGRYLNGRVSFNFKFEEGFLSLNVADLEANGHPAPRWLLSKVQKENFLKSLDHSQDFMDFMQRIESVEISDGYVVVTPTEGK